MLPTLTSFNRVAIFQTDQASRYLRMLCVHFGRRVDCDCSDTAGCVTFPFGICNMTASDDQLELVARANTTDDLSHLTDILTRHLERYAFRENPHLDWRDPP
ncbi:MAG: DUF2218 domain-containing protein [Pseudomonadota bacterium]